MHYAIRCVTKSFRRSERTIAIFFLLRLRLVIVRLEMKRRGEAAVLDQAFESFSGVGQQRRDLADGRRGGGGGIEVASLRVSKGGAGAEHLPDVKRNESGPSGRGRIFRRT